MERRTNSYLQMIKPGITLSNTLATVAGFFLAASAYGFNLKTLVAVTAGVALIVASACVLNNIIDRDIDTKMKRTSGREIAAGKIDVQTAAVYAVVMAASGFWFLIGWTNWLTVGLGVLSYVWYVAIYGWSKRTTPLSTAIGSVCGALPPAAGYVALSGQFDTVAWTLFQIMLIWQMPHFFAIAIFRANEYKKAGLPVWSVKFGTRSTRMQVMTLSILFALTVPMLTILGATGIVYLVVMCVASLYWVMTGLYSQADNDEKWAKQMFGASIIVLLVTLLAIGAGGYLP